MDLPSEEKLPPDFFFLPLLPSMSPTASPPTIPSPRNCAILASFFIIIILAPRVLISDLWPERIVVRMRDMGGMQLNTMRNRSTYTYIYVLYVRDSQLRVTYICSLARACLVLGVYSREPSSFA